MRVEGGVFRQRPALLLKRPPCKHPRFRVKGFGAPVLGFWDFGVRFYGPGGVLETCRFRVSGAGSDFIIKA